MTDSNIIEEKCLISLDNSCVLNTLFTDNSSLYPILKSLNTTQPDQSMKSFTILINEELLHMKQSMIESLMSSQIELTNQYNNYITSIQKEISQKEEKLSSIYLNNKDNDISSFLRYVEKTIFSKLTSIISLHSNIQTAIEKNINMMKMFLNKSSLFKEVNPLEAFVRMESNNIFSSWLFSQINFDKINISHLLYDNQELNDLCKKFICLRADSHSKTIDIKCNSCESFEFENTFLNNNVDRIQQLKIFNMNNEESIKVFSKNKNNTQQFPSKVTSLSISKSDLKEYEWTNSMNDVELSLSHCRFKKMIINSSFIKSFMFYPQLKHIAIKKCNLNDKSFENLLDNLRENDKILNNLEVLSLPGNHFTHIKVIFCSNGVNKKKIGFSSLAEINLEGNNIYDFSSENFNYLPQIKILNLCNNNFSSFSLHDLILEKNKTMKCLLLLASNNCVINNKNHNTDYYNYLLTTLGAIDYPVKSLSFSLVFNRFTIERLNTITLSPCSNIYLKRLNLSYCSLSSDILLQFLRKNNGLPNLTHLKLSNNIIDMKFFDDYNKANNLEIDHLQKIDISSNLLRLNKPEDILIIQDFFIKNSWLKKMKLQNNPLEKDLIDQYKDKPLEELIKNNSLFITFANTMIDNKHFLVMKTQFMGNIANNDYLKKFLLFKNKDI